MTKQNVKASYLLRVTEDKHKALNIYLQNLKTGQTLEFETWVSILVFLGQELERPSLVNPDT